MLVPAKLYDPIFGVNVISGMVISADYMTFCNQTPIARVGDMVLVTGIVGTTIITEVGFIVSGCASVGQNGRSSGFSFPNINPFQPVSSGGSSPSFNVIKAFFDGNPSEESIPNFLNNLLANTFSDCEGSSSPFDELEDRKGLADSDCVKRAMLAFENAYRRLATQFDEKLKKGLCGAPPTFPDKLEEPCEPDQEIVTPFPDTPPRKPKFGAAECLKNTFIDIRNEYLNYLSRNQPNITLQTPILTTLEDLNLDRLQREIKDYKLLEFTEKASDILNIDGFRELLSSDSIDFSPSSFNEVVRIIQGNFTRFFERPLFDSFSFNNTLDSLKDIGKSLEKLILLDDLDEIISQIECHPKLGDLFDDFVKNTKRSLDSLIPPPPIINQDPINQPCKELDEIVDETNNLINSAANIMNGDGDAPGCITQNLLQFNISKPQVASLVIGGRINPANTLGIYSNSLQNSWSNQQTELVNAQNFTSYVDSLYSDALSSLSEIEGIIASFGSSFTAYPEEIAAGVIGYLADIENIINTVPNGPLEFIIQEDSLGSYKPEIIFANLLDAGGDPSILDIAADPALLSLASVKSAIESVNAASNSLATQVETILNKPFEFVNMALNDLVGTLEDSIDVLSGLQNCLPPFDLPSPPSIDLNLNLDDFNIGLPFAIPDIEFPFDLDITLIPNFPPIPIPPFFPEKPIDLTFPSIDVPRIPLPPNFPPTITLPPLNFDLKLPQVQFDVDVPNLDLKFPERLPRIPRIGLKFNLPIPLNLKLPPLDFKFDLNVPNPFAFGENPFRIPKISVSGFPPTFSVALPKITIPRLNLNVSPPSINFPPLPKLNFPFLSLPKLELPELPTIQKLKLPEITIDGLNIPSFPQLTVPMICSDLNTQSLKNAFDQVKNSFAGAGRILSVNVNGSPISFSPQPVRPTAVSIHSVWISPHFTGYIVPIPCGTWISSPC